jgi:glutaconate CoA-transferase subunit B
VDFITSPGFIDGGKTRTQRGFVAGGMWRVVTDLVLMGFDEDSREMCVLALHPGVTSEQVQDSTGFDLHIDARPERTAPPREDELRVLRDLDPDRLYTA